MRSPAEPARGWLGPAAAALACLAPALAAAQVPPPPPPPPPPADPAAARDPFMAELDLRVGGTVRIGSAPAFAVEGRGGTVVAVGLAVVPSPRWAVGLAYEHASIGSEHGAGDLGTVDVSRTLDSLWATLRLSLYRGDWIGLGVILGPGLVWQSEDASVIVLGDTQPTTYQCSNTTGPGLGLRGGLGADLRLGHGFFFSLDAVIDELRLSSDPIGACAPGVGTPAVFGVRGGLSYRLDVSRYTR